MWLQVGSSPSSCGHIVLSVPPGKIYRTYSGTAVIYIYKPEQVKVHAHSIIKVFHCIAQRDGPHSDLTLSPSPASLSSDRGISEGKSRLYIQFIFIFVYIDFVFGFRFGHSLGIQSCTRTGPILYSWQKSITAQLARGVTQCPETGKRLPFHLPLSWVPEKY